jgi:hypothetical protein
MTHFSIEQMAEQPDRIFVEVDRRFDIAIIRTETGLEFLVYPRTQGELWDMPFTAFTVNEAEVVALEAELYDAAT